MKGIVLKRCLHLLRLQHTLNVHRSISLSARTLMSPLSATAPSALGYTDYETERNNFKLEAPEYYNFALDVIDKWAKEEKVILVIISAVITLHYIMLCYSMHHITLQYSTITISRHIRSGYIITFST